MTPRVRAAAPVDGPPQPQSIRHLVPVLGDQLDLNASALDDFDASQDVIWMAEVMEESTHVWSGKPRTAVFLSAMRHFAAAQRALGRRVHYVALDDPDNTQSLSGELARAVQAFAPQRLVMTEAGDWRVQQALVQAAQSVGVELEQRSDRHFYASVDEFRAHAKGRKQLRLEYWYRELRQRHAVLLTADGKPEGGQWNFDAENRGSFGKQGPVDLPAPQRFAPDHITREVLTLVNARLASHPGSLEAFDWPVTPEDAQLALQDFVQHRLPQFGTYQDAMWTSEPWLYHSRLSAAMNLKLLDPRHVVQATERAYREGHVPLAAAEGFIRQILGWREYVRGIYWLEMPSYLNRNALDAREPLPSFYWSGDTEMRCLQQAIGQTLDLGYAHHIQRLMVTGLYALLLGVNPVAVHEWYLAVYVDAVEWVELPNTLGMSQYADGGIMASKPYAATGKYIQRMSNYCAGCRFDPAKSSGEDACPFTTLYWDFLLRHEPLLARNQRMALQVKNLARLDAASRAAITDRATQIRQSGGAPPRALQLL
ncbi:MAG: cryptochrome/photolyase family protein [Gemmatimonadaceae bacterium]|nr:cryptochrome/photolyase family protein [Gemmatimonadaceae bacterium]